MCCLGTVSFHVWVLVSRLDNPSPGPPKISRFFFPLPPQNSFFSSLSVLLEFWWCLKRRDVQMCAFGVLRLSCRAPAARSGGAAGVSHDSLRVQTCTFEGPGLQNTTKIQREDTQRGKERTNFAGEEKNAKFWAPPPFGAEREREKERKWGRERDKIQRNFGRRVVRRKGGPVEGGPATLFSVCVCVCWFVFAILAHFESASLSAGQVNGRRGWSHPV